jgi:hypothetical protein
MFCMVWYFFCVPGKEIDTFWYSLLWSQLISKEENRLWKTVLPTSM